MARFITFEGGERSGKSTQAKRLVGRFAQEGVPAILVREPGSTPLGERLRPMMLSGEFQPTRRTETLLMAAARAQLVETVVAPALAEGTWVVCDRYLDSSLAYQGAALGLGIDRILALNTWATDGLSPDRTFLLDMDPAAAAGRESAPDAIASRGRAFHEAVRQGYLEIAQREPNRIVVIDARLPADTIERQIWHEIGMQLKGAVSGEDDRCGRPG